MSLATRPARELAEQASPLPWEAWADSAEDGFKIVAREKVIAHGIERVEDARFLASAKEGILALCEEIERVEGEENGSRSLEESEFAELEQAAAEPTSSNGTRPLRPTTRRMIEAIARCRECGWVVEAANALAVGALHHDRSGHTVSVHLETQTIFGEAPPPDVEEVDR